jgi:hypothetical protein
MKVLMHALAASCEELRARTGNPPLQPFTISGEERRQIKKTIIILTFRFRKSRLKEILVNFGLERNEATSGGQAF